MATPNLAEFFYESILEKGGIFMNLNFNPISHSQQFVKVQDSNGKASFMNMDMIARISEEGVAYGVRVDDNGREFYDNAIGQVIDFKI